MPVVGDEKEASGVGGRHQRQEISQILGRAALPQHDMHSGSQLLSRLIYGGALVIRADAGSDVGRQIPPREAGRVPVHRPALRQCQLGHHLCISQEDAGIVHHLRQAQDPILLHERSEILCPQACSSRLQIGGRNAGGQHDIDIEGHIFRRVQNIAYAFGPPDIGQLMGVGHHGSGAPGNHRPGILRNADHAAL